MWMFSKDLESVKPEVRETQISREGGNSPGEGT